MFSEVTFLSHQIPLVILCMFEKFPWLTLFLFMHIYGEIVDFEIRYENWNISLKVTHVDDFQHFNYGVKLAINLSIGEVNFLNRIHCPLFESRFYI